MDRGSGERDEIGSFGKSSAHCKGRDITCAMQHADNENGIWKRPVADRIGAVEGDAQPGSKLLARRRGMGKIPYRLEGGFDCLNQAVRHVFGSLLCRATPDLREVGFAVSVGWRASGRLIAFSPVR